MTNKERRLLGALARMCEQYIGGNADGLDHQCMSAGEEAFRLLVEYGLAEPDPHGGRGGGWTAAGKALLETTP